MLELYTSRGKQSGKRALNNTLYRNNGDGTFADVTSQAGVDDGRNTWAAACGDYDKDGFLDLFVARPGAHELGPGNANILDHNNRNGTFTDVVAQEGVALQDDLLTSSHKLTTCGACNNDGFLDLAIKDGVGPNLATGDAYKGLNPARRELGHYPHVRRRLRGG
jgi:hypothetical protein